MTVPQDFTFIQMRHFATYEKVRERGRFNMFDPRAHSATGLDPDEYVFVIDNYVALRTQYEEESK